MDEQEREARRKDYHETVDKVFDSGGIIICMETGHELGGLVKVSANRVSTAHMLSFLREVTNEIINSIMRREGVAAVAVRPPEGA